jgi:hypothetical protein
MSAAPDDDDDDDDDDKNVERYSVDDFFVPTFPPASYVYVRYSGEKEFNLLAQLGTIEAANKISDIMLTYDDVEIRVVDLRALN